MRNRSRIQCQEMTVRHREKTERESKPIVRSALTAIDSSFLMIPCVPDTPKTTRTTDWRLREYNLMGRRPLPSQIEKDVCRCSGIVRQDVNRELWFGVTFYFIAVPPGC